MYEEKKGQTNSLPALWKDLEYIPVSSDPVRRVHVSCVPKKGAVIQNVHRRIEQKSSLVDVMDKVAPVVGFMACVGMAYLLIRMSYGIIW